MTTATAKNTKAGLQWQPDKILGVDYRLPPNMKRLKGWVIGAVYPNEGTVSLFAPKKLAPQGAVPYSTAEDFIARLKSEGHETAHLLRERDAPVAMYLTSRPDNPWDDPDKFVVNVRHNRFWFSDFKHWGERLGANESLSDPPKASGGIPFFPVVVNEAKGVVVLPYAAEDTPPSPSEAERGDMAYAYAFGDWKVVCKRVNVNKPQESHRDQTENVARAFRGDTERVQPGMEIPTALVVAVQEVPMKSLGRPQPR